MQGRVCGNSSMAGEYCRQGKRTRCEVILRCDAKGTLTALTPAPGDSHAHEAHSHAAFNGEDRAYWQRSTAQPPEFHRQGGPECP